MVVSIRQMYSVWDGVLAFGVGCSRNGPKSILSPKNLEIYEKVDYVYFFRARDCYWRFKNITGIVGLFEFFHTKFLT